MDLLEIGPVNACKKAFKIDEAMWKTFKSDCAVEGQEKSEGNVLKLRKEEKKIRFQVEGIRRAHAQAAFTRIRIARYPDIRIGGTRVSAKRSHVSR